MNNRDLFSFTANLPLLRQIIDLPPGSVLPLDGICSHSVPFLVTMLRHLNNNSFAIVTGGPRSQELFQQDILAWTHLLSENSFYREPFYFPSWDILPQEDRLPLSETLGERLQTFQQLVQNSQGCCLVTQVDSILQKTFSPKEFVSRQRLVQKGQEADPEELRQHLNAQGYDWVAKVSQKGEAAIRGGIMDIYPLSAEHPIRIEFFGSVIESIREFDPNTQLSLNKIESALIPPAGEIGILRKKLEELTSKYPPEISAKHFDLFASCIIELLPSESFLVISEPEKVQEALNLFRTQVRWSPLIQEWEFLIDDFLSRGGKIILAGDCDCLDFRNLVGEHRPLQKRLELRVEPLELYCPYPSESTLEMIEQQRRRLFDQIQAWRREGFQCYISYSNDGEYTRIRELWDEIILGHQPPNLIRAALSRGVIFPDAHFVLITDNEVFCRRKFQRSRRLKNTQTRASRSQLEIDFDHIETGDLVVHIQHGIAKYLGIGRIPTGPKNRFNEKNNITDSPECLILEFAPDDPFESPPKLYVPVTESHLVSKYIGVGHAHPPLSRLGGKRWNQVKAQAEKAVQDVASDLLRIQALRKSEKGFAYPPDTDWQHTFENAFEYEETPDQIRAIEETKRDMESEKPMDRLVCGDVGFGKTEVAIRAAFKAVMAGKQVALLAPTTVLVQQHYNSFCERMAGYPFRIETLSRFKTKQAQNKILAKVAAGDIDIIIGTHRLVQNDIRFKDLGLFIIDEEQRFGVKQKEKIKQLKVLTDVLTLSATPIPRTLYMALAGIKSMSSIETPPQERLPVKTIICQFDEEIIRDAIQRELNRQGQVFFLHNRVSTIDAMEMKLKQLMPHARIAVGHGQMQPEELEKIMSHFVNGEVDILLSTTIIESGIDIPNANTIIIDRADRFGLSELYQLRGRVGRYRNQAFAYLLIPRHAALLADARKRISAIKQYSRLGSGFKIAMRDLEIRGAGNILGSEQSGHISAIGFDLYCRLLKRSISNLKGEKAKTHTETRIMLDFLTQLPLEPASTPEDTSNDLIPLSYINDPIQRLEIYRRLAQASCPDEIDSINEELLDRFGKMPLKVQYLIDLYLIRVIASLKQINSIETDDEKIIITRAGQPLMINNYYPRFTKKTPRGRLKELLYLIKSLSSETT